MDKPGFIVPPPWLVTGGSEEATVPAHTVVPTAFPAFLPVPLGGKPGAVRPPLPVRSPEESPAAVCWRLALDDGQSIIVDEALVLGRDPAPVAARSSARLVPVHDPARSVSKTHALLDLDGVTLSVTDLGSTNGVAIMAPDGTVIDLEPGGRGILDSGSRLILGEFTVVAVRE